MWHWSKAGLERRLESLLHTHDTPRRTAFALAIGVAIGFSPFIGLHLIIGLLVAFLFNLNRVAVIGGVCVNLPWLMGFYYAATTALGTWLLGTPVPERLMRSLHMAWQLPEWDERMDALRGLLEPLLWPFTLGSVIGAIILSVVTYHAALPVLTALRRRREQHAREHAAIQKGKSFDINT
jgi:uncharacterized protein (DUF2062 family)